MTATITKTVDELAVDLAAAKERLTEAEQSLGSAVLTNGRGQARVAATQARRAAVRAQEEVEEIEAAVAELERRREAAEVIPKQIDAHRERARTYEWMVTYFDAAVEAIRAHEAAEATMDRLCEVGARGIRPRRLGAIQRGFSVPWVPGMRTDPYEGRIVLIGSESDFDTELQSATGRSFSQPRGGDKTYRPFGKAGERGSLTIERCKELQSRAEELAGQETEAADALEVAAAKEAAAA